MTIKKVQNKIIKKQLAINNKLLNVCNEIEFNINKRQQYNKNNNIINIHVLNEHDFKFYLMLNGNFKDDYKTVNKEYIYLKDIILFYKKYLNKNNKKLLNKINNLMLDNKINNIQMFYSEY